MRKMIVILICIIAFASCSKHYTVAELTEVYVRKLGNPVIDVIKDNTGSKIYMFTTLTWDTKSITFISNSDGTDAVVYRSLR